MRASNSVRTFPCRLRSRECFLPRVLIWKPSEKVNASVDVLKPLKKRDQLCLQIKRYRVQRSVEGVVVP